MNHPLSRRLNAPVKCRRSHRGRSKSNKFNTFWYLIYAIVGLLTIHFVLYPLISHLFARRLLAGRHKRCELSCLYNTSLYSHLPAAAAAHLETINCPFDAFWGFYAGVSPVVIIIMSTVAPCDFTGWPGCLGVALTLSIPLEGRNLRQSL